MEKFILNLDGPSIKVPNNLSSLPFDYVARYQLVAEIITRYFSKAESTVRILDVGGSGGPLQKFLPNAEVTVLDSEASGLDKRIVIGDGTDMKNVRDATYDVVVSCDTLEHIPRIKRPRFISELNRVSKDMVILCAPYGRPDVADEEARVQQFYLAFHGSKHRWLREHKQYGLPEKKEVNAYFKACGVGNIFFSHNSLKVWSQLIKANLAASEVDSDEVRANIKGVNECYNNILFNDFTREGYRFFVVGSKKKTISWDRPKAKMLDQDYLNLDRWVEDLYTAIIAYSERAPRVRKKIDELNETINSLNSEIGKYSSEYQRIIHSKTWRYTSPARKIAGGAKRAKRLGNKSAGL